MATTNVDYVGEGSAFTINVLSLADGGYQSSDAITNDANQERFVEILVSGSIRVGAVAADGNFSIYGYGSADGGTTFSGGVSSTGKTITWGTTDNTTVEGFNQLKLLEVVSVDTTDDNNDIRFGPFPVAGAFGGTIPADLGIVVLNETGVAFAATAANNQIKYTGIEYSSV